MAKYRIAGKGRKPAKRPAAAALPCVIIIFGIFAVIMALFYFVLKSGS